MNKTLSNNYRAPFASKSNLSTKIDQIGVESEKIALFRNTFEPVPITGPISIQSIMRELSERYAWTPHKEEDLYLSLSRDGSLLSLEPGGQLELSTLHHPFVDQAKLIEDLHLRELKSVCDTMSIDWFAMAMNPISSIHDVPWLLKKRYIQMKRQLRQKGSLSHWMMKMTASTQVTLDFDDPKDLSSKVQVAARICPVLIAAFSNSPFMMGRLSGYKSTRALIWQHTDPVRCGLPMFMLKNDIDLDDYIQYALSIPDIDDVYENHKLDPSKYLANNRFLEEKWKNHLSLLFPDIRIKSFIELRYFDKLPQNLTYAAPIICKLIFYDAETRCQIMNLMSSFSNEEIYAAWESVPLNGFDQQIGKHSIGDLAIELGVILQHAIRRGLLIGSVSVFEKDSAELFIGKILSTQTSLADIAINEYKNGQTVKEFISRQAISD